MDDTPPPATPPRASSVRGLVIFALICFAVGIAVMGWLLSEWTPARNLLLGKVEVTERAAPAAPVPPPPGPPPPRDPVATPEEHIAEIEQKLAIIDQQADSASNDAARAERMMIAFAARRAIDRGSPLGYLEGALMRQFGPSDPAAVSTIIKAGRAPVTLEQLEEGLEASRDAALNSGAKNGWMDRVWNDVSGLAVIRRKGEDGLTTEQRFDRARRALERDRVELAVREVEAAPSRDKAEKWLESARRYVLARRALDRLEAITLSVAPKPVV